MTRGPREEDTPAMKRSVAKYLGPLLLLGLLIALYVESGSIQTVEPQAMRSDTQPVPSPVSRTQRLPSPEASRLAIGERYASLDALVADQKAAGYLRTGTFGQHWPATVVQIETSENGIDFVRKDGTAHRYQGFEGYRMKVVHLRDSGDQETLVVFRSENKR